MPGIIESRSFEDLAISEAKLLDKNMMLTSELEECSSKLSLSRFKVNDIVWIPVKPLHMDDEEGFPVFECQVVEILLQSVIKGNNQSSQTVKYILSIADSFSQTTQDEEAVFSTREEAVFSTREEAVKAVKPLIEKEIENLMKRVAINEFSLSLLKSEH